MSCSGTCTTNQCDKFEEFAFSGKHDCEKKNIKTDIAVPTIYVRWIHGLLAMMHKVRLRSKVEILRTDALKLAAEAEKLLRPILKMIVKRNIGY